jgi:hypothetical protein
MTKENKNYICCRIQENTESNLSKVLELLTEITNDEHYYNYELSDFTHETRLTIVEILKECYKEENKFRSIFDNSDNIR